MTMFRKILVPLDGSDHSTHALEVAVRIAKEFEGRITLIHVYSVSAWPIGMPGIPESTLTVPYDQLIEGARKTGSAILVDAGKKGKNEGIQVKKLLKEGHTVEEILRTAREGKFDLIVMGARGISRIKEILLGSVTDGVMRHAPCPVLVVK